MTDSHSITPNVYGRWTVLENHGGKFLCKCRCGTIRYVLRWSLVSGRSTSCGCYHSERIRQLLITHGRSKTALYKVYCAMRSRCYVPNTKYFAAYGGRGITICSYLLESFEHFYAMMGDRPTAKHTIDRTDNDGGYWCGKCTECIANGRPTNLRWATRTEQSQNRRINRRLTLDGKTLPITAWARLYNINVKTLDHRLKRMSLRDALEQPVRPRRKPV